MVYGRYVFGSHAAVMVACPKPLQTGVDGLKRWVRSTSSLLRMTFSASASVMLLPSAAKAGVSTAQKTVARAARIGRFTCIRRSRLDGDSVCRPGVESAGVE